MYEQCGFLGGQSLSYRPASSRRSEVGPSHHCLARSTVAQISSKRVAFPRVPRCSFTAHARETHSGGSRSCRATYFRQPCRARAFSDARSSVGEWWVEGRARRPSTFSASALNERTGLPRNQLVLLAEQERCELPARTLKKLAERAASGIQFCWWGRRNGDAKRLQPPRRCAFIGRLKITRRYLNAVACYSVEKEIKSICSLKLIESSLRW